MIFFLVVFNFDFYKIYKNQKQMHILLHLVFQALALTESQSLNMWFWGKKATTPYNPDSSLTPTSLSNKEEEGSE